MFIYIIGSLCPPGENYWPCQCTRGMVLNSLGIICNGIPTAQVAEIFKAPNETVEIYTFHLEPATTLGEVHIPENFLSYRCVIWELNLKCPSQINDENEKVPITIHPNAFNSSSDYFINLIINNCDLSRLDFSFLNGFHNSRVLNIINPTNIEKADWNLLSPLPSLTQLEIDFGKAAEKCVIEWVRQLRPLTNGLNTFIGHGGVDDKAADRLIQWLLNSSAATLQHLKLYETKITEIPPAISNFKNLEVDLIITCSKDSEIRVLAENSIKINVLPSIIEISNCGIRELQSGAIQGRKRRFI